MANPFLRTIDLDNKSVYDIQFPTLTLCADQINDRWNLARALLNQIEFQCLNQEEWCLNGTQRLHEEYSDFFLAPLQKEWINDHHRDGLLKKYQSQLTKAVMYNIGEDNDSSGLLKYHSNLGIWFICLTLD